jgi:hypothetical protein
LDGNDDDLENDIDEWKCVADIRSIDDNLKEKKKA